MKKKILIVGGSHSEVPLILAAQELNLYVITTGNQANGLGHQYSDEYHLVDYADEEAIYLLAKKLAIDYICFGAHDLSIFSTVYAASKLGIDVFDDYDTTQILHHKDKFKQFALEHNLLTPRAYSFETKKDAIEFTNNFTFPCIVKPIDMGGGKGISVINERSQIDEAINNAFLYSKNKKIVVEEFFEGSLHSFSTFIEDEKVIFSFHDDEYACQNNPFGVCTSTSPTIGIEDVEPTLVEQINKISHILSLKDGLLHLQYLKNGNSITIVELTRRIPGDMYDIPVKLSTGVDYAKNIIKYCCGIDVCIINRKQKQFISRHCLISDQFSEVIYHDKIKPNIVKKVIWGNRQGIEKKGIVFLKYDTVEEMLMKSKQLNQLLVVK